MLEWTGERFLPWLKDATIAYEHLHRYAYASLFAERKRVLDMASGEGYGSNMLAQVASSVVGIDIDETAVRHAAETYKSHALSFLKGSITAVPVEEDHSFDLIVCFEAIEHIADHELLLGEVSRLLKPDGLFIVSTPNKPEYDHQSEEDNPFHVKELEFEQFRYILASRFRNVKFLGQRIFPSSSIWPIDSGAGDDCKEFVIERGEAGYRLLNGEQRIPLYFIALASNGVIPPPSSGSVLLDRSCGLFEERTQELKWREKQIETLNSRSESLEKAVKWQEEQISDRSAQIASMEEALKWRESEVRHLTEGLVWSRGHIAELEKVIASRDEALAWRAGQVEGLQNDKDILLANLQSTHAGLESTKRQLIQASQQLEAIQSSRGWKFILFIRRLLGR